MVGSWANVQVKDGRLVGRFVPAEAGTSELADSVRKLVDQNILRATSVGFEPIESEPIDKDKPYAGQRFIKSTLLECSIVSVPANANAVAIARSLRISDRTISLAFGEHAKSRLGKAADRICPNCGAEVPADDDECPSCGHDMTKAGKHAVHEPFSQSKDQRS